MGNVSEIIDDVEKLLSEHGKTLDQFIQMLGICNAHVLQLDENSHKKFSLLYEKIIMDDFKSVDKGKLLEDLACSIFIDGYPNLLECRKNCRTSTNEIDILLNWTQAAHLSKIALAFPFIKDSFLCECKHYKTSVNVTYVGRFYSLLKVANSHIGLLISWEGVTGRTSWSDAKGLIKKIALSDKIYIIVLDKTDLQQIYDKTSNIFAIIRDKYSALINDIDYSSYITKHENEHSFTAF